MATGMGSGTIAPRSVTAHSDRGWTLSAYVAGLRGSAIAVVLAAIVACIALGATVSHFVLFAIALLTLLPIVAHVAFVGPRRAIAEPTVATVVVAFYVSVFGVGALAVALQGLNSVELVRRPVSEGQVVAVLALASIGTTLLIVAFHLARGGRRRRSVTRSSGLELPAVTRYAWTLTGGAVLALGLIIAQHGGLSGAEAVYYGHNKALESEAGGGLVVSLWAIVAVPSVWAAVYAAGTARRWTLSSSGLVAAAALILVAEVVVFGSRLDVVLALMGGWVVWHSIGRRVAVGTVAIACAILVGGSIPLLAARGAEHSGGTLRGVARIASYGELEAALAVHQEPEVVRRDLTRPARWLDAPAYLVPSFVWPGRPNIGAERLDVFIAQAYGDRNQQQTGFPSSYITEVWLYGGWLAVCVWSVVIGALAGYLQRRVDRRLVGAGSPAVVLWTALFVTAAFSYYKDGDILVSAVGVVRTAAYLALLMTLTGVWGYSRVSDGRRRRSLGMCSAVPSGRRAPGCTSPAGYSKYMVS